MRRRKCKHDDGRQHNCAYVRAVNQLIPVAEAEAKREVANEEITGSKELSATEFAERCNRAYFRAMNRLAAKHAGRRLVVTNGVN